MKHQIMLALLLGAAVSLQAQTTAKTKKQPAKRTAHTTAAKRTAKAAPLDERKNYQWKDGQTATPAGHQATGVNQTEDAVRDSVSKKRKGK